ncbi:MAG: hypothetical protein ACFFDS_08120 [Candidatus Thorarchaeota archaeon]
MKDSVLKKDKASTTLGVKADKKKHKLDVAAIGFSLMSNKRITNVFRLSCILNEEIDTIKLQTAISTIISRLPYYRVSIKKGLFWGKLVTNLAIPKIQTDSKYPCQYIPFGKKNLLYKIIVDKSKISLEYHHCLTDGGGGLIFLNSIIAEYFRIKGLSIEDWNDILLTKDKIDLLEYEDAYDRYKKKKIKVREKNFIRRSFYIPEKVEPPGVFHLLNVYVSLESIRQKSKEFNVSITTLLTTIYYFSLVEIQETIYQKKTEELKPISIRLPVNLRKILKSKTMRNFSAAVRLDFDPKREKKSFEATVKVIHDTIKNQIQKDKLIYKISRNIKTANLLIMHIIPFQIKRFIVRTFYYLVNTPFYSGMISNLGQVSVPEILEDYIDSYEFTVGPSAGSKERISLVSFKDKLVLTFSSVLKEHILVDVFKRKLEEMGIKIY